MKIVSFKFKESSLDAIKGLDTEDIKYGTNWPVVYILNNETSAYIGESSNVHRRAKEHLKGSKHNKYQKINIILDDEFNKSATLDYESFLIKYMSANRKLGNLNSGLYNYDYFDRGRYTSKREPLWNMLRNHGLIRQPLTEIEFEESFIYSPYKALTTDQFFAVDTILTYLIEAIKKDEKITFLVHGTFGTGKTILATYLMKLLQPANQIEISENENTIESKLLTLRELTLLKTALVVPQQALRKSLSKVFKNVNGLKAKDVIKPYDVPKEKYDLLIVDEAHRLQRPIDLGRKYNAYHANVKRMGLDDGSTELDWIIHQSKYQILFYSENQIVRSTDIRPEDFYNRLSEENVKFIPLEIQMRVKGGADYIKYIEEIFSNVCAKRKNFKNYEFYLYDDISKMRSKIVQMNDTEGYSRLVAGYAWEWKSKEDKTGHIYDIEIGSEKMRWNHTYVDWINSANAINEVGCIHTVQGYDLNYCGVIIGPELDYDFDNNKFVVYADRYKDIAGKRKIKSEEELLFYILNIYKVLFTRGMSGTYVYAHNENMRKYLKKFMDVK